MNDQGDLDITIVICTYNRQALLRKTLESIAHLRNPGGTRLSVIVVDNSDDSNALQLVETMGETMPWPLLGLAAHPANISVARNAGVAATRSEFIAFIDDDQQLDSGWLAAVSDALATHPHDVFFGHVEALHEIPNRVDQTVQMVFSRWLNAAEGHELYAMGPRQTRGIALGSGNSIFRRSKTLTDPAPFDPAFGNGGGEDSDLFCRLQRRGLRFGWLPGAKVFEFVPASRHEPDYMASRLFAGGQAYALAVSRNSAWPSFERWRQRAIAIAQLILLLPRQMLPWQDEGTRTTLRYRRAAVLGKLSFREMRPIYLQNAGAGGAPKA